MPDADGHLTLAELELARPLVERSIGRELRHTERVVDVFKLTAALEKAKADLTQAIKAEQRRAVRKVVLGSSRKIRLDFTPAMRAPLERLVGIGKREARAELLRAGYDLSGRSFVANMRPGPGGWAAYGRKELAALSVRIDGKRVEVTAAGAAQAAVIDALYAVTGSLGIASKVVSTALDEGLASTFADVADLVSGWEFSSVLDGATCSECESMDGETFETWEEIEVLIPLPDCEGGGSCRCGAIPLGPL